MGTCEAAACRGFSGEFMSDWNGKCSSNICPMARMNERQVKIATLLSVNVGLPREVAWRGQTVRTAVWKTPVLGKRMARRLNIDGDAQGDLKGHGGEHRA